MNNKQPPKEDWIQYLVGSPSDEQRPGISRDFWGKGWSDFHLTNLISFNGLCYCWIIKSNISYEF
jgi:hypothetical protein